MIFRCWKHSFLFIDCSSNCYQWMSLLLRWRSDQFDNETVVQKQERACKHCLQGILIPRWGGGTGTSSFKIQYVPPNGLLFQWKTPHTSVCFLYQIPRYCCTIQKSFNSLKMGPEFHDFPTNGWVFGVFGLTVDGRYGSLSETWFSSTFN